MHDETTTKRKDAHLELCAKEEVAPVGNFTLFDGVKLVHCALPELHTSQVDLTCEFLGKKLRAPILITGMTGGSARATQVNRDIAQAAEEFGVAFGVGSQRAMAERPELTSSFAVRDVAPNTVLIGNIGAVQAAKMSVDSLRKMVDAIGADALAVHLNPAQELNQPEGDRDFLRGLETIGSLVKVFGDRLLVKETGCGISPEVAKRLVDVGVKNIDVSGLGGTSWVRVEELRSSGVGRQVGAIFSGWGIPTAAAIASVRVVAPNAKLVASGGVRNGLDIAKALALGADLGGLALPLFRAQQERGLDGVRDELKALIAALTQALALTGSTNVSQLRKKPKVLTGEIKDWLAALGAA